MTKCGCAFFLVICCMIPLSLLQGGLAPKVCVGSEQLWSDPVADLLKGKRIGLITNHTAVNSRMQSTIDGLKSQAHTRGYVLAALFAPEHGIHGSLHAAEEVQDEIDPDGIPIFSLHGKTRRPTADMLKRVDLLIYDIQDIGVRSYTYVTTLFYAMEEAAKRKIPVIVLDRPNPINGLIVDGPMLTEKWRSFLGYVNVPYCHGMTVGELAKFFNEEYHVGCSLYVVPMKGWARWMSFSDTGLAWIPTSPHIPEANTAFFYPTTGLLGELSLINIGIGYTLPFKVVGAPWIDAQAFAKALNKQHFPGVYFEPFHYRPFYGKFAHENCQGALIVITNPSVYKPVYTQYLILGTLKSLYPKEFKEALMSAQKNRELFCKVTGTDEVYRIMKELPYLVWSLKQLHQKEREEFMSLRQKYLLADYSD
jgi:uncharacterized protein YbbC (DUF1343 family)